MHDQSLYRVSSRPALYLALLAVLLTAGWQSVEAGHFHTVDDSAIECLLCNGPGDTVTPISDATPAVLQPAGNPQSWASETNLANPCIHYPSRGPPHYA